MRASVFLFVVQGAVHSVHYSPSGRLVASGSADCTVRIWTSSVCGSSHCIKSHIGTVRSVSWSLDEGSLLSCSDDKVVKIWDCARNYRFKSSLIGHSNWIRSGQFSADGRLIVTGSDDRTVRLWDVRSSECVQTLTEHTDIVEDVAFLPESTSVVSASRDSTVKLFDLRTAKLVQHYDAHGGAVKALSVHPSGHFVVSASTDKVIKVWDIVEGHQLYTIHGHESPINDVAFSADGRYFASCSDRPFVLVWKTNFDRAHTETQRTEKSQGSAAGTKTATKQQPAKQPPPSNSKAVVSRTTPKRPQTQSLALHSNSKKKGKGRSRSSHQTVKPHSERPSTAPIHHDAINVMAGGQIIGSTPSGVDIHGDGGGSGGGKAQITDSRPSAASVVPEQISSTLEHIVNQLGVVTQTLAVFEERLNLHEDRVVGVEAAIRALARDRNHQQHPAPTSLGDGHGRK